VVTGWRVRVGGGGSVNVWSHLLWPGEYIVECGGWRGSILGGEMAVMGFGFDVDHLWLGILHEALRVWRKAKCRVVTRWEKR